MSNILKNLTYFDKQFRAIVHPQDLAKLLKIELYLLQLLAMSPQYNTFRVLKKNGKTRLIEDPEPHLKQIQKQLNRYLQSIYHFKRTDAAYGFQIAVKNETDTRDIVSNARRHRYDSFMLKADFKDFFHQISEKNIIDFFEKLLPEANTHCLELLTQLCCYNGRLPMGAPTSPVLSNLFTIQFDNDLQELARKRLWTYTRFADDLVFSADSPFSPNDFTEIQSVATIHDLYFNPDKTQFLHNQSQKIVTGILLTKDGVSVPPDFFDETVLEIQKLKNIVEVQSRNGLPVTDWIEAFKDQIKGQINFVKFVLGDSSEEVQKLVKQYEDAVNDEQLGYSEPVSWINLAYLV
ncbi:reverse transcriptase family protein [Arcicella aquatica]|uniref:RNA-directed DNA polymerase n=1 Tax=Arcicella aquatica TaxID=217141 RepID=A0ABU5QT98_9BACT|nr:reverse transcriptase family protein [Arcicella aquatica]MEA5260327.1 reverse transcriptase family protein [Arcicella aquatica]